MANVCEEVSTIIVRGHRPRWVVTFLGRWPWTESEGASRPAFGALPWNCAPDTCAFLNSYLEVNIETNTSLPRLFPVVVCIRITGRRPEEGVFLLSLTELPDRLYFMGL